MPDLMRDKFRAEHFDIDRESFSFVGRLINSMATTISPRLSIASGRKFQMSNGDITTGDNPSPRRGTQQSLDTITYEMSPVRRHSVGDEEINLSVPRSSTQSTQRLIDSRHANPLAQLVLAKQDQHKAALCKVRLKHYGTNNIVLSKKDRNKNTVNGFADTNNLTSANSHVWL